MKFSNWVTREKEIVNVTIPQTLLQQIGIVPEEPLQLEVTTDSNVIYVQIEEI